MINPDSHAMPGVIQILAPHVHPFQVRTSHFIELTCQMTDQVKNRSADSVAWACKFWTSLHGDESSEKDTAPVPSPLHKPITRKNGVGLIQCNP